MKQIRRNVFETNSSSTHSITMCMKSDYDRWIAGELVFNYWRDELVEITPEVKAEMEGSYGRYLTYEQFNDYNYVEHEHFKTTFKTENNEEIVAFGYYGHD